MFYSLHFEFFIPAHQVQPDLITMCKIMRNFSWKDNKWLGSHLTIIDFLTFIFLIVLK
jgi:hypothetical protein